MTQTPAGWYPDPESTDQQRYWDGTQWTEHRAPVQPTYQPPTYPDPAAAAGQAPGGQAPSYQQPGQTPPYGQPGYGQQGYPAGFQGYAPATQSHTTRNVLIIIGVIFVLLVGGCFAVVGVAAKGVNDAVDDAVDNANTPHQVTYRVGGTATSAMVTYTDDDVSGTSDETVSLPFEKELTIDGSFFNFYSLTVTSVGDGTVSCEILVDGTSVDTETSDADFGFVSCDHSE